MTAIESHGWCYSLEHQQPCQVLSTQELWGEIVYLIWLPDSDSVVRLRADQLKSIEEAPETTEAGLAYAVAGVKGAEALPNEDDALIAPLNWAQRLKRVFNLEINRCPFCSLGNVFFFDWNIFLYIQMSHL